MSTLTVALLQDCTGAVDCPATAHLHGCFADDPCTHVADHGCDRAFYEVCATGEVAL